MKNETAGDFHDCESPPPFSTTKAEAAVSNAQAGHAETRTLSPQYPPLPAPLPVDNENNPSIPLPIGELYTAGVVEREDDYSIGEIIQPTENQEGTTEGGHEPDKVNSIDPHARHDDLERICFDEEVDSGRICTELGSMSPQSHYPIPADHLWNASKHVKKGAMCTIAWTFDNRDQINISIGKVTSVNRRKGAAKLNLQYKGIAGHKIDEEFFGTLPPQETVRVYKIIWHCTPPPPETCPPKLNQSIPHIPNAALPVPDWD